jgi:FAD/FMN-containing dehydrogenase
MTARTRTDEESIAEQFGDGFRGDLIEPDDPGYDEARTVWNGMIDRRPALVARCRGVADVVDAVRVARDRGGPLSVKAGGHSVAGNAVCDDGLVIDLSLMDAVRVDPEARTVRVEPGVRLGDLDHETQAFGLAVPAGVVSTTGVAGLTLGGGWGWLSRTYGLTIDNLRSVDLVTADGELLHASETEHEDLFWGVRGGGGNFGVVTAFEFDCHEVGPELLAGLIVHPFEDAADVLRFHREFATDAPDEVCCYAGILNAPPVPFLPEAVHGTRVVVLVACYSGSVEDGEAALRSLREYGDPIADAVQPMPYTALQQLFDEAYAPGARNYWKSALVDPLPDEAIDLVVDRAETFPSPETQIVVEHLRGAIATVDPSATAYRHRNAAFAFNVFPRWADPADDEANVQWAAEFVDAIRPFATDGVALNFLGDEGEERVRAAFGDNYDRLVALKDEYDPENLFRSTQNVRPTA